MSLLNDIKSKLNIGKSSQGPQTDLFYSNDVNEPMDPQTADGVYSVKIVIGSGDPSVAPDIIIARLPEKFSMSIESQWEDLVSQSTSDFFKGINFFTSEFNNTHLKSQIMSAQVWSGNSPLEFQLPLQFKAFSNSQREVMNPLKTLMKAALPSLKGSFLSPPGPKLLQASDFLNNVNSNPGRPVALMIGKVFHFSNLIILRVEPDINTIFSVDNNLMSVDCTVTFRTIMSYTAENIEEIFIKYK